MPRFKNNVYRMYQRRVCATIYDNEQNYTTTFDKKSGQCKKYPDVCWVFFGGVHEIIFIKYFKKVKQLQNNIILHYWSD